MTTEIFGSFLHSLDTRMGAQNRKIMPFLDNCAAHSKDTPFLRNVRVLRSHKYDIYSYVTLDRDVATSSVPTVEELCEAYGSTRSVEDKNKENENLQDMVPNFAETYEALEKVKAFFYAHSVTDADREHTLGLEKSYFQLRKNSAKKQKTVYDFFCLKKVVLRISRFPVFVDHFRRYIEKLNIERTLHLKKITNTPRLYIH
jgi:hypothetical protein